MIRLAQLCSALRSWCRCKTNPAKSWAANEQGIAAVEFAMIVPIMIVLFLGAVEFSDALSVERRVTTIADSTCDLVTQSDQVSDSDLADIMKIANSLLGRADPSRLKVTLISVTADNTGTPKVDWSYGANAGAYGTGSVFAKLSGTLAANASVVVSEVSYVYKPPVGHFIVGTVTLYDKGQKVPRQGASVKKV